MSTRSSLFLTTDSEHCYTDCSRPHFDGEKNWLGDELFVEINTDNLISLESDADNENVTIVLKPGTEIYEQFMLMDFDNSKIRKLLELASMEISSCYKKLGVNNSNVLTELEERLNMYK